MNRLGWVSAIALFLSLAAGIPEVHATEAADTQTTRLTWEDCVVQVKAKNSSWQASRLALNATQSLREAANRRYFPRLALEANLKTSGSFSENSSPPSSYEGGLTFRQNLYSGLALPAELNLRSAEVDAALADLQMEEANVSAALRQAFAAAAYARDSTILAKRIADRRDRHLKIVRLRFQNGHENKGSVLLAETKLAQARYDQLQAENLKRIATRDLMTVLGSDQPGLLEVIGDPPQAPPAELNDLDPLILQHPRYTKANAQREQTEAKILEARSLFRPSLEFVASTGLGATDLSATPESQWSAGLFLNWPLFASGRSSHLLASAQSAHQAAKSRMAHLRRELAAELQHALSTWQEAVVKLEVDEQFKEAAAVRAEVALARYNNGLMNFENWDIIEDDFINREKSFVRSRRDRVIAEANWQKAQGKGSFD